MAFEEALDKKAQIVCICSGGKLADLANQNHIDCLLIPPGKPPRACLGFSMVQILYVLQYFQVVKDDFISEIKTAISFLEQEANEIEVAAKELAAPLSGKLPVIYADQQISGIATRWRQQINENAKMLGWERILPEMNHNELVGWRDQRADIAVVFLQNGLELDRVQKRIGINKKIIQPYTNAIYEVHAKGDSYFDRAFYLILLGDWLSWYLAQLHGVDATEVKVIDYLKGELAGCYRL
jgi:glucose/mannose-6-phosphate isomerase